MNKSDSIKEIATALSKAQGEFQNAKKEKVNPFFGKKYADLAALWNTCRPVLSKHGLSVVQGISSNESNVTINTLLMHDSGEWIESELGLHADQPTPQKMGSAITYGRRYSLSAMLGLAADEDDDGNEASKKDDKKKQGKKTEPPPSKKTEKKEDPPPPQKTEKKNGAPKVPERQEIIDKIVAILKNDKFDDKDRVGVKAEIKMAQTNIALEALRAIWQIELNKRLDDFVDDIPEELTDEQEKKIDEVAQTMFPAEEKAAQELADRKQLEEPDIF